jgi:polysaccharide export outer membrane protein
MDKRRCGIGSAFRLLAILLAPFVFVGCSTLASLGLPFGSSGNRILGPAKAISEAPSHSLSFPREMAKQSLPVYLVEIGDTILIEPVKFEATIRLPGDQVVKPDGVISLGEFGRLYVVNKTIEQIRYESQEIINAHLRNDLQMAYQREHLERVRRDRQSAPRNGSLEGMEELPLEQEPDHEELVALERRIQEAIAENEITARLINWESKRIYVLGEVNSPGSFTFSGNQTVLDAIIEAGGLTSTADRHQILLARPSPCDSCRVVGKICYDHIVQLGDTSTNYQLWPGDRVFVPSLTCCDDLKRSLFGRQQFDRCPRCADCPQACPLPTGCY